MPSAHKKPQLRLQFDERAREEWNGLDGSIKKQFKKKLEKLINREEIPSIRNALSGDLANCYKIKLRSSGHRLVYKYDGNAMVILVIALGKRERNIVYEIASTRTK